MTFILGMKCTNGLILAADSLEVDGIKRRYRDKLERLVKKDWSICWGGSGSADVIDKVFSKLKQRLDFQMYSRTKIEKAVEECLASVNKSHPQEHVEIIVGLFGKTPKKDKQNVELRLYKGMSRTGCLAPEKHYYCAGMADSLSEFLLRNTYFQFNRVTESLRLCIFVIAVIKEYVQDVGGQTKAWSITENSENAEWIPLLDRRIVETEKELSVLGIERLVYEYWHDNQQKHFREWYDESNRNDIGRKKR